MPDTLTFIEALQHLRRGGCIKGPGLPSREHIVDYCRIGNNAEPLFYVICNGINEGTWNPKPLDMIRKDWFAAEHVDVSPEPTHDFGWVLKQFRKYPCVSRVSHPGLDVMGLALTTVNYKGGGPQFVLTGAGLPMIPWLSIDSDFVREDWFRVD